MVTCLALSPYCRALSRGRAYLVAAMTGRFESSMIFGWTF